MKPDAEAAIKFLAAAYPGGPWCLTAIVPDGSTETRTFMPDDGDAIVSWIAERNERGMNIYFSVNRPLGMPVKKTKKQDIAAAVYFHVDVDPRLKQGHGLEAERQRIRAGLEPSALAALGLPPASVVIDSGGGYGVFWRLDQPAILRASQRDEYNAAKVEAVEAINIAIAAILAGGDHCHNIDRIMRLPGTINYPNKVKRELGRGESFASLVSELTDFERRYPSTAFNEVVAKASSVTSASTSSGGCLVPFTRPRGKLQKLIKEGGTNPDRSADCFSACLMLVRQGLGDDAIADILTDPKNGISAHYLDQRDPKDKAMRDIAKAREKAVEERDEENSAIERMNAEYAVTWGGGDALILRKHFDPGVGREIVTFVKQSAAALMLANQFVMVGGQVRKIFDFWLAHSERRTFRSVVFEPWAPGEASKADPKDYNLFRGWGVEPDTSKSCELFLRHTLEVICGGDQGHYRWMLAWLAQALRQPTRRPGTAIVLRGGQGAGKGIWVAYFGLIYGLAFLHLQSKDRLLGRFNNFIKDALLVFADEAIFGGDRSSIGLLNAIITEPTVMVEPKFKDAMSVRNHMRLVMATNADWSVPTDHDARRFFMPNVSDHRKGDSAYFEELAREMDNGGAAALLHYLMHYDIGDIDLRNAPKTRELAQQKERSLDSVQAFWLNALQTGYLVEDELIVPAIDSVDYDGNPELEYPDWASETIKVSKTAINQAYLDFARNANFRYQRETPQRFWAKVDKMCQGAKGKLIKRPGYRLSFPHPDPRRRGEPRFEKIKDKYVVIPPLAECRAAFDRWQGHASEWEQPDVTA